MSEDILKMDSERRQARRFSGLIIRGKAGNIAGFKSALSGYLHENTESLGKGNIVECEYTASKNHYPEALAKQNEKGEFLHNIYIAELPITVDGKSSNALLVCSPYVRLLGLIISKLHEKEVISVGERSSFLKPEISKLFELMVRFHESYKSTRVTVEMFGEAGLERVSLSGNSPLRSDLHEALSKVSRPYALRIDINIGDKERIGINFDRHGNIWWHLKNRNRLESLCGLIEYLNKHELFSISKYPPLKRADS